MFERKRKRVRKQTEMKRERTGKFVGGSQSLRFFLLLRLPLSFSFLFSLANVKHETQSLSFMNASARRDCLVPRRFFPLHCELKKETKQK